MNKGTCYMIQTFELVVAVTEKVNLAGGAVVR